MSFMGEINVVSSLFFFCFGSLTGVDAVGDVPPPFFLAPDCLSGEGLLVCDLSVPCSSSGSCCDPAAERSIWLKVLLKSGKSVSSSARLLARSSTEPVRTNKNSNLVEVEERVKVAFFVLFFLVLSHVNPMPIPTVS